LVFAGCFVRSLDDPEVDPEVAPPVGADDGATGPFDDGPRVGPCDG
jgi:hypothetical protein